VVSLPLENVAKPLYRKLFVALNFLFMSLHMHWVNIPLPTQNILILHPVRTHCSAGSRTRPANAGTRNPRWLTRPAQDYTVIHIRQLAKNVPLTNVSTNISLLMGSYRVLNNWKSNPFKNRKHTGSALSQS